MNKNDDYKVYRKSYVKLLYTMAIVGWLATIYLAYNGASVYDENEVLKQELKNAIDERNLFHHRIKYLESKYIYLGVNNEADSINHLHQSITRVSKV